MGRRVRAVCLVIDGLGVGEMRDVTEVKPEDAGANTLLHIARAAGPLSLPTLSKLGLGNIAPLAGLQEMSRPLASHGRLELKHYGADTFMGHQELMGTIPARPVPQLMLEAGGAVRDQLTRSGYQVRPARAARSGCSALVVNEQAVIADNVEAQRGFNINVTASLDQIDFDQLCRIGEVVRNVVDVIRVIVVGGRGYTVADIEEHIIEKTPGQMGVDTPALGVYDEWYRVRHLGKRIDLAGQVPTIACAAGMKVCLIGKAADVVLCEAADIQDPVVPTNGVFDVLTACLEDMDAGLIVANVQESDLAGHQQDPVRWREVLELVDRRLRDVLDMLTAGDLLVVTGDHGNDPTIGHSQHTREMTPILSYVPGRPPTGLGTRKTLADVGASLAHYLGLKPTRDGTSVFGREGAA